MAVSTVSNLAEILAYQQSVGALDQFRADSWMLSQIDIIEKKATGTPRGDAWLFALDNFIGGIAGAPVGGTSWGTPISANPVEASYGVKQMGHLVELEDRLADKPTRELVDIVRRHIDYVKMSVKRQTMAYWYGDGTGTMFKTQTAASGTSKTGTANDYFGYTRWLRDFVNSTFDAGTSSNYTASTSAKALTSVTSDTVAVFATFTSSASDLLTLSGTGGVVPEGIALAISASGTYANINRATAGNEYWKSYSLTTTGALSPSVLDQAFNNVAMGATETPKYLINSDDESLNGWLVLARAWGRSSQLIPNMPLGGKESGYLVEVSGRPVPWIGDPFAGRQRIYIIDMNGVSLYQTAPPGYMQPDRPEKSDAPKFLFTAARTHQARYAWDCNFIFRKPQANGVLLAVTPVTA